jgi:cytochrome b561
MRLGFNRCRALRSSDLTGIDPVQFRMAAPAESSLNSWHHSNFRENMLIALYGCMAILAVVAGVLGLVDSTWLRQILDSWINIHVLFGWLLCGLVIARCQWRVKHSPRMLPTDVRELSRHLSRIVYLLLYVVIGVRQSIGIAYSIWHGGAVDFNLFDKRFRNGPDTQAFDPKDDFQLFVASGLCALIFIRVLAFRLWLRSIELAAPSKATAEIDVSRASK